MENKESNDQLAYEYKIYRTSLLAKNAEDSLKEGNYEKSISYLMEFFEIMNTNYFPELQYLIQPCIFNLALAYSNIKDYENAIKYWTKFIQSDKNNFSAYFERCRVYFEINKIVEAISDIDCALNINPKRDDLFMNKGIAYFKLGNTYEARKAFLKAKELGNDDADNFINKYC